MTYLDGRIVADHSGEQTPTITDITFRALGSDCRIALDGEPGLADAARDRMASRALVTLPGGEMSR